MKRSFSSIIGFFLILVGAVALLINLDIIIIDIKWYNWWPAIFWILGLSFEIGYFTGGRKDAGVLVPGGLFLTYAVIFTVCVFAGWSMMTYLWPLFILGPAVGLFQLFLFGGRDPHLLIPVGILSTLSAIFIIMMIAPKLEIVKIVVSIVVIIIGGILLLSSRKDAKNFSEEDQ